MAKTMPKAKNSAFMKPMQPSVANIVGTEPLPRSEVTKKIWAHIKKHKLQNPKNKREILAVTLPRSRKLSMNIRLSWHFR
jgi:chromatin remodeling complex protein RSC6